MFAMTEENPVSALVWTKQARSPRRPSLSIERIIAASVAIADTEGLDALSMRRVAAALDSGTTSLYRYVAGRDELLDLMIDTTLGENPPAPPTGDWRADLTEIARNRRAALLKHPWLGTVMSTRPPLGPNSLRQTDTALAAAGSLTADITMAADVISLVTVYVYGLTSRELSERELQQRTNTTKEEWRASIAPYIREVVASGEYPQFARRVIEAEDHSFDELFEFGLSCLLDGIAARVPHSAR
jgi:AcrR family transcriptional regulator